MNKIRYLDIVNQLKKNSIEIESNIDSEFIFSGINTLLKSRTNDLTFFSNTKYIQDLKKCKAKACLIEYKYSHCLPEKCTPIITNDPYLALAFISELFNNQKSFSNGTISKNVTISNNSKLHSNIEIGDYCTILDETEIFDNVIIGSNSKIGPNVQIHKNSIIHDNVSISNAIINENCEIKSGARVGSYGFGFEEKTKQKIKHIGNVVIHKNSTIGSNTTIDRAVFDSTSIGEFSQIDNLVQIAHNVIIGSHAIIAAQVGIAGSTQIGKNIKIGGQAGIAGHLVIGDNVTIAAKSGVTKNIPDNNVVAGFPAKDINLWKKEVIRNSLKK